jgi:hypothetical protein
MDKKYLDSRCDEVDVIRVEAGGVIRKFKDTVIRVVVSINNCFCSTLTTVVHFNFLSIMYLLDIPLAAGTVHLNSIPTLRCTAVDQLVLNTNRERKKSNKIE